MANSRKNVIIRLADLATKEQEERRCLEELTNSTRKDVEDLLAAATQRVYQLRGRTVIVNTPEGTRRKKAARNDVTALQTNNACQDAMGEQQEQGDKTAMPPAPAPAAEPEHHKQAEEGRATAQDPPEATEVEPSTARAGQKRGRIAAASQAKSKRTKAQTALPETSNAAATVVAGGEASPCGAKGELARGTQEADVHAEAATAHGEPIAEATAAQPPDDSLNSEAPRARGRARKPAPRKSDHTKQQAEAATTAPIPEAAAAGLGNILPRVTRSRRGQPAPSIAPELPAPATTQTRGRSTRQKRDLIEAQLGSPGLHLKTKTATVSGAGGIQVPPVHGTASPDADVAAARDASVAAAADANGAAARDAHDTAGSVAIDPAACDAGVAAALSEQKTEPAPALEDPSAGSSCVGLNVASCQPSAATEQHGTGWSVRPPDGGPQLISPSAEDPGKRSSPCHLESDPTHPGASSEQLIGILSKREQDAAPLDDILEELRVGSSDRKRDSTSTPASATEEPAAGRCTGEQHGTQQSAASQPESHRLAPQPQLEDVPSTSTTAIRMPAQIAATVAMIGRRAGAGRAGGTSGKLAVANELSSRNDPQSSGTTPAPIPASSGPKASPVPDEHFSFGTKPKEQSSPAMPHFGVAEQSSPAMPRFSAAPSEQAVVCGGAVEEATPDAQGKAAMAEPLQPDPITTAECAGDAAPGLDSVEPLDGAEHTATPVLTEAAPDESGSDTLSEENDRSPHAGQVLTMSGTGLGSQAEFRNRSPSLCVPLRSPSFLASGAESGPQQDPSKSVELVQVAAELCDVGSSGPMECNEPAMRVNIMTPGTAGDAMEDAEAASSDDIAEGGPGAPGQSPCRLACDPSPVDANDADATGPLDTAAECGTATDICDGEAGVGARTRTSCGVGARTSSAQAVRAQKGPGQGGGQPAEGQGKLDAGGCADQNESAQLTKPKGGNVVSAIRSFLPQRAAPSPPPAAGKKAVKVKALEAAQAAKQKEAARAAERAFARAAAADRRQGEVGPSNAGGKPGGQIPGSVRLTPTKSAMQQGGDVAVSASTTLPTGIPVPANSGVAATATCDEKRTDCATAAAVAGSVKAKAAFWQLKEEQAKKAAVEQGAGRKQGGPAGGGCAGPASGVPSYKAGANARVALAVGDNDAALAASAAAVAAVPGTSAGVVAGPAPSASRAVIPVPVSAPAETAVDKHKRVEAKRREEEERRRAELEARTKAKDDKLRNFEAAKQQQRLAGGAGGTLRPPAPPAVNPSAMQSSGKRPPLNIGGTGPLHIKPEIKPEPENFRTGPAGHTSARTPGPKLCPARTPAAKVGPVASSMVSPAVQLQVKLLPAVHAQGAPPEGGRGAGGAPGLPKPRPQGTAHTKQAQVAAVASAAARGVTPGTADLTEEERRNVHAIQTSPYIMQVKPRTPGLATASKPIFSSYEISPYRSDSDASDDDDEPGRARKPMPSWAASDEVLLALQAQSGLDPDIIFGSYPSTIDLVKVFSDMPPPGDTDARGRPRRDFRRRGSSGVWDADMF